MRSGGKAMAHQTRERRDCHSRRSDVAGLPHRTCLALGLDRHVEEQRLGIIEPRDAKRPGGRQSHAVALVENLAVERNGAARDLEPSATTGPEDVLDCIAFAEQRRIQIDVLMDGDGAVAGVARPTSSSRPGSRRSNCCSS